MAGFETAVIDFIRNLYQAVGWPGVLVAMAIESANIPLPSEVIMPLAGWMLIKDVGLPVGYIVLAGVVGALGCTLGSAVSYWIGAVGGRPLVMRFGRYVLISPHDLDRADRWFAKWGDATAFFSRLLPVVRTFISFPAGIAKMHFVKFLLYTFIGSLLWSTALAYAGYVAGEHWEAIREAMRPFDIPIVVVILALVALYVYRHIKSAKRNSMAAE